MRIVPIELTIVLNVSLVTPSLVGMPKAEHITHKAPITESHIVQLFQRGCVVSGVEVAVTSGDCSFTTGVMLFPSMLYPFHIASYLENRPYWHRLV